jgi:hypothetical protein
MTQERQKAIETEGEEQRTRQIKGQGRQSKCLVDVGMTWACEVGMWQGGVGRRGASLTELHGKRRARGGGDDRRRACVGDAGRGPQRSLEPELHPQ